MSIKPEDLKGLNNNLNKEALSHIEQLNFPAMSLTSLLQFGSGMLLKEAIAAEITTYGSTVLRFYGSTRLRG